MWEYYNINSLLLILLVVIFIVIFKKQLTKRLKIRANCWFCNENTYVLFKESNSFVCPSCGQYNGFRKDGDYNKSIPEQQDEMLNNRLKLSKQNYQTPTNGLCKICNNNQQLKVYQLANFVPLNEDRYDVEIEHFQKQLEKAYKLCPKCDTVVKTKVAKQNKWMLGLKIRHLQEKGPAVHKSSNSNDIIYEGFNCKSVLIDMILLFPIFVTAIYIATYQSDNFLENSMAFVTNKTIMYCGYGFSFLNTQYQTNLDNTFIVKNVNSLHSEWRTILGKLTTTTAEFNHFIEHASKSWYLLILYVVCFLFMVFGMSSIIFKKVLKRGNSDSSTNISQSNGKLEISKDSQEQYSDDELTKTVGSGKELDNDHCDYVDSYNEMFRKTGLNKKQRPAPSPTHSSYQSMPVFGEKALFDNNLNKTLSHMSFSNLSALNESFTGDSKHINIKPSVFNCNSDLNASLSNLNIGTNVIKPKPVFTQFRNPWTGGYWEADTFSQSSSQSSGFYSSNDNYNSLPNSATNSCCDDFECSSLISEPILNTNLFRPIHQKKSFSELNHNRYFSYASAMYPNKYGEYNFQNVHNKFDSLSANRLYGSSVFLKSAASNQNRFRHCFNRNRQWHLFEKINSKPYNGDN